MKFRELEGIEEGVKIKAIRWQEGHYIYWSGTVFVDEKGDIFNFSGKYAVEIEWEYYKELEPELFCPVCGNILKVNKNFSGFYFISCINACLMTGCFPRKNKVLKIWKEIGGVR